MRGDVLRQSCEVCHIPMGFLHNHNIVSHTQSLQLPEFLGSNAASSEAVEEQPSHVPCAQLKGAEALSPQGVLLVPQKRLKESRIWPWANPLLKSLPSARHGHGLGVDLLEGRLVEVEGLEAILVDLQRLLACGEVLEDFQDFHGIAIRHLDVDRATRA